MNNKSAKNIVIAPIAAKDANVIVKRLHYSGKVCNNSQLHLGVFMDGVLEGAMQFGPSLDKRKIQGLVKDTPWNGFIELNRMAFSERLPRNSESRALSIALRLFKKHYPHIEWIVSFADGTQSGDGTIYRASGFVLTQIKKNTSIWEIGGGGSKLYFTDIGVRTGKLQKKEVFNRMVATDTKGPGRAALINRMTVTTGKHILETGSASMKPFIDAGARPLEGFQLRYIYFLDPTARERLTVPILPFSKIEELGAGMYKGKKRQASEVGNGPDQGHSGGAAPTRTLHNSDSQGD